MTDLSDPNDVLDAAQKRIDEARATQAKIEAESHEHALREKQIAEAAEAARKKESE
jgi:hypothetical protein